MLDKLIPFAVASTSFLTAATFDSRLNDLEDKVSALSEKNVLGGIGGKNPSARAAGYDQGVFLTAEALYWKATQDGLESAIELPVTSVPPSEQHGKVKDINFKWGFGFRAGVGYNLPYDGWDLYLNWTWLHRTSSSHIERPSSGTLEPLWLPPTYTAQSQPFANSVSSRWKLHYDTIDLELGRSYFISRALAIRPFMGVRGAFIHQRIRYHFNPQSFSFFNPFTTQGKNNFNAAGLRTGFSANWFFSNHWSLFGKASITLAQGKFHVSLKESAENDNPALASGELLSERNSYRRVKTNFEAGAGLLWETYLYDNTYHIGFSLAYEVVQWINQNQLREAFYPQNFLGSYVPHQGDLGIQGITLSGRFDF